MTIPLTLKTHHTATALQRVNLAHRRKLNNFSQSRKQPGQDPSALLPCHSRHSSKRNDHCSVQGKMAWNKAIECFSILSITETLCENLTAYTEIKLYRACKAIHYGNQIRRNWWQNMEHMIQITLSKHNLPHEKTGTPLVGVSLQERPSHGS